MAEGAESSLLGSLIGGYVLASPHYVFGVDWMANAYDVERQCVAFLQLDVFGSLTVWPRNLLKKFFMNCCTVH